MKSAKIFFGSEAIAKGVDSSAASQKNTGEKETLLNSSAFVAQMYGYVGETAFGFEWQSEGKGFSFIVLLGKATQSNSGEEIRQLTTKYEWHPFSGFTFVDKPDTKILWEPLYTGISFILIDCDASYCDDERTFVRQPDRYPDSYYPPTAIIGTLNLGTTVTFGKLILYAEVSMTSQGLDAYYHNRKYFEENYDYGGLKGITSS